MESGRLSQKPRLSRVKNDANVSPQPIVDLCPGGKRHKGPYSRPILFQQVKISTGCPSLLFDCLQLGDRLTEILVDEQATDVHVLVAVKRRHQEVDQSAVAVARYEDGRFHATSKKRCRQLRRRPVGSGLVPQEPLKAKANGENHRVIDPPDSCATLREDAHQAYVEWLELNNLMLCEELQRRRGNRLRKLTKQFFRNGTCGPRLPVHDGQACF